MGLAIQAIKQAERSQAATAQTNSANNPRDFTASLVKASNDNITGNSASTTGLATTDDLNYLFNLLAGCNKEKPCDENTTIGFNRILWWIQNTAARDPKRRGLGELNFDDFSHLHDRYGNALARLISLIVPRGDEPELVWTVNDYDAHSKDNKDPIFAAIHTPDDEPEIKPASVRDFAELLVQRMDPDGTGITREKFTEYMLKNRYEPVADL